MTKREAIKTRRGRRPARRHLLAPMALTMLLALPAGRADAGTYVVTSTFDGPFANQVPGTLRYAIAQANANPGSTINFSLPSNSTFLLGSSLPALTAPTTVDGSGAPGLTISGSNLYQGFSVNAPGSTVTVRNLTVTATPGQTVTAGTLFGSTSTIVGNVVDNGTVTFSQGVAGTYGGVLSGSGSVQVFGSAPVTLAGANTYTGGTTVTSSNLLISSDANLGAVAGGLALNAGYLDATASLTSARAITLAAATANALNAGAGATATFTGIISGSGGLIVNAGDAAIASSGTVVLSGQNTYTGGTNLSGGTLQVASAGNLGSGGIIVYNGATLATTSSLNLGQGITLASNLNVAASSGTTATLSGVVSGSGSLGITGPGTVALTGANTYTGGTTVAAGSTLQGNTTSLQGNIADNGTLVFNQAGAGTYAGNISGSGSVQVLYAGGAFGLTFSGTNTYTGGTTVNLNDLLVSSDANLGAASGALTLTNGGYLDATANLSSSRAISLGANNGATFNSLNAAAGVTATFSGVISGSGTLGINGPSAAIADTGTVALTGANTYTGGINLGGGTLQGNTTSLQGNIADNGTLVFNQAGAGTYAGNISGSGSVQVLYAGGAFGLTFSGTNTYTGGTTVNGNDLLVSSDANLGAASGALTLTNAGYLDATANLSSSRAIVLGAGSNALNAAAGVTATFSGVVSGSTTLAINVFGAAIADTGTVVLTGANTYTGGISLNQGTLQGNTSSLLGNISDRGTLIFNQAAAGTYGGVISGPGSVRVVGSGGSTSPGVTFTGNNTYSGGTTVDGGNLLISSFANIGSSGGLALTNAGYLDLTASLTSGRAITLSGGLGALNAAAGTTSTFSGVISGPGTLGINGVGAAIADTGTIVLTGQNTYTGGTNLGGGTLQIASASNLGSGDIAVSGNATLAATNSLTLAQNVALGANLTLAPTSGTTTLAGNVSGAGSLTAGSGTVVLAGTNSYTGGTTVAAGATLQGTTASIQGNIVDNGVLAFNQAGSGTEAGAISGTGSVTVAGGGTVTLTGANTYTGGTTVAAGSTLAGNAGSIRGAVVDNGTVTFNQAGAGTLNAALSGAGNLVKSGLGTLTVTGNSAIGGTATVAAGALNVADGASLEADAGVNVAGGRLQLNGPGAVVAGGPVAVSSGATVTGTGTLTGNLAVAQGGAVSVGSAGDLIFNGATNSNAGTINLGGGTLEFANALTNSGTINGRGTLFTAEAAPGTVGLTNAGQMNLSGGFTDVHGVVQNNVGGTITSGGGGVLTFYDGLTNQGTVNTVSGSRTVIYGTASGTGGYNGAGTVEIDGTILVQPSVLAFGGNLTFTPSATYVMAIGGTGAGTGYGSVAVAGLATLGGVLDVSLTGGFMPMAGQSFTALTYGSFAGAFDEIDVMGLAAGLALTADYTPNGLILTVRDVSVPEPASMVLVALGLAGAGVVARRRPAGAAR